MWQCLFGDLLKRPTCPPPAYFIGGSEENWVKKRFPNANLRGVTSAGTTAPLEELMTRRADFSPINRVPWVALDRKVKGLAALPREDNCQASKEQMIEVGSAIDKNQPVFLHWLAAVTQALHPQVDAAPRMERTRDFLGHLGWP